MKHTKVVHIREVRALLDEWNVIRQHILQGQVSGWMGTLQDADGQDTVYLGGVFHNSSEDRLRALRKMSAARVQLEEPPLSVSR